MNSARGGRPVGRPYGIRTDLCDTDKCAAAIARMNLVAIDKSPGDHVTIIVQTNANPHAEIIHHRPAAHSLRVDRDSGWTRNDEDKRKRGHAGGA